MSEHLQSPLDVTNSQLTWMPKLDAYTVLGKCNSVSRLNQCSDYCKTIPIKTIFQYIPRHDESLDAVFYFELSDICGSCNLRCRAANNEHNSTYSGT